MFWLAALQPPTPLAPLDFGGHLNPLTQDFALLVVLGEPFTSEPNMRQLPKAVRITRLSIRE